MSVTKKGKITAFIIAISIQAQKKPNIVFIMADDIGMSNIGPYGGGIMGSPTPNLDKLAKEGTKLTTFYAQPSCTAGRAAFATGQLPVRVGLQTVCTPGATQGLHEDDVCIAQVLRDNGYQTAQYGKNHLGDNDINLPNVHGYDVYFGNLYHLNASEDYWSEDCPKDGSVPKPRGLIYAVRGKKPIEVSPFKPEEVPSFDRRILDSCKAYVAKAAKKDKPFFLYYNPSRMHVFQKYEPNMVGKSTASITGRDPYGDGIIQHDKEVGELMDYLDQLGLTENTIVVYTTDNGPYQYMWPEGGTTPFAGDKGTTWEGGVRVPCIIRWPGHIAAAETLNGMVSMTDWLPTFASIAGDPNVVEKLKKGTTYDGKQFKNLLDGMDVSKYLTGQVEKSPRNYYWYFDGGSLTAYRINQFKFQFALKMHGKWDDPLQQLGRSMITNLEMDPYERRIQTDVNRRLAENYEWLYQTIAPDLINLAKSFKEYPPKQGGLSINMAKDIEEMSKTITVQK